MFINLKYFSHQYLLIRDYTFIKFESLISQTKSLTLFLKKIQHIKGTFINFFYPVLLFGPIHLLVFQDFPPRTFIRTRMFIRHLRVNILKSIHFDLTWTHIAGFFAISFHEPWAFWTFIIFSPMWTLRGILIWVITVNIHSQWHSSQNQNAKYDCLWGHCRILFIILRKLCWYKILRGSSVFVSTTQGKNSRSLRSTGTTGE